jgi:hypothetical protein
MDAETTRWFRARSYLQEEHVEQRKVRGYPYFGVPPARAPRPAATEPALTGKRVILSTPEGFVYDMRAAAEIRTDGQGKALVPVITERQHFERILLRREPQAVEWPAHLVWVE